MWGRNKFLEREGRWWGWQGVWLQCLHELLVALARLEGRTALSQGGKSTGTTLCLSSSQVEQSQGHPPHHFVPMQHQLAYVRHNSLLSGL